MKTTDFTLTLNTEQTPQEVFEAIKNVRAWWCGFHAEEINGDTEKLNDEFSFRAAGGAHFSKQKLVEVIPNKRIVWLITESDFAYVDKKDEWTGTKVIFDITKKGDKAQLVFTHKGLVPEIECYESCAPSWSQYLQYKLLPLINKKSTETNK
jgi:activator of Hsp90 ATPase-like protein